MKFLVVLILFFVSGIAWPLQNEHCPKLDSESLCTCKDIGDKMLKVVCRSIKDDTTLLKEIQQFRFYPVFIFKLTEIQVPYLPAGLFNGTSVEQLEIVSSDLQALYSVQNSKPSPFEGIEDSLTKVRISHTKHLTKWYWPDVQNFKNLKTIEIESSPMDFVSYEFSKIGGGSLEYITVADSRVYRIHPQAFSELTNLKEADFSENKLPYLVRTMFPNPAPYLRKLNFRSNALFTVNENMFENMPGLRHLDLSQNEFKTFENVAYDGLWNQLDIFHIAYNPFICDCSLQPLHRMLISDSFNVKNDFDLIHCSKAKDFKKYDFHDLDFNNMQCDQ